MFGESVENKEMEWGEWPSSSSFLPFVRVFPLFAASEEKGREKRLGSSLSPPPLTNNNASFWGMHGWADGRATAKGVTTAHIVH